MVDHFDAFVQTAMDIVNERAPSKKEHQGASQALEVLNTETMLQLLRGQRALRPRRTANPG